MHLVASLQVAIDPEPSSFPELLEHRHFRRGRPSSVYLASGDGIVGISDAACGIARNDDGRPLDTIALFDDTRGMTYDGGKGQDGVYQRIINQMPPHKRYIEPFLGQGAILRHKRPAEVSIGLDLDTELISFWQEQPLPDVLKIGPEGDAFKYLAAGKSGDPPILAPWGSDTLVYCDPPYLGSTRRAHRPIYRCELEGEEEHERLLQILLSIDCLVMISGYWSQLYADLLRDWRPISFQAITRGGSLATEWLWMNFPEPTQLHDYRYLGANFRERERIKRKKARWVNRLRSMPRLERQALSAALAEVGEG